MNNQDLRDEIEQSLHTEECGYMDEQDIWEIANGLEQGFEEVFSDE